MMLQVRCFFTLSHVMGIATKFQRCLYRSRRRLSNTANMTSSRPRGIYPRYVTTVDDAPVIFTIEKTPFFLCEPDVGVLRDTIADDGVVSSMAAQPDGLSGVGQMYAELRALDGVMKLFADSTIILPAWIHYLAVDMIGVNYLVEKNLA